MLISKFECADKTEIDSFCKNKPRTLGEFLKKYNGGETPETSFCAGSISSDLVGFYGVGNVKYSYNGVAEVQNGETSFLPVAFDSFGNKIVMSMNDGTIGFLDHEKQNAITVIAKDLKEFIDCAKSEVVNPKHLKTIEEREKELISRGKAKNISDSLRELWKNEIDKYSQIHQVLVEL